MTKHLDETHQLLTIMASEKDPLVSERSGTVREVGNHAIWSLSSCKPGNVLAVILLLELPFYI